MAEPNQPIIHQFSRKHARTWKIPEAILLSYMSERVRKSKNVRDDKRWFYNTAEEIAGRFRYWHPNTVDDIIRRLTAKKLIEIGSYNKWSQDRTRWFTVTEAVRKMAAEDPIYFRVADAERHGIRAALVLFNLESNVEKQRKANDIDIYHDLVPSRLAKLLPISGKELERIIKQLREAGAIVQLRQRSALYTLPDLQKVTPSDPGNLPSLPGMLPSDPGETPSNPVQTPSDPGDITHCKPLEAIEAPLEKPFETPQASPAVISPSLSGVTDEVIKQSSLPDHFLPDNYNDLKERCKLIRETLEANLPKIINVAEQGCYHFVNTLSGPEMYNLSQFGDRDKTMKTLLPVFASFFDQAVPAAAMKESLRLRLFTIALDMLTIAFVRLGTHNHEQTAVFESQSQSYGLCIHMIPFAEKEELRQTRQAYEEARREHASPDEDKEELRDLAPAQKARVLRQAVEARNAAGWHIDYGTLSTNLPRWVHDQLTWSYSVLAQAEKFFSENSDANVAEVIEVLDQCVQVSRTEDLNAGAFDDPYRMTRKALDVSTFLFNAESVLKELRIGYGWKSLESTKKPYP